jgi:16S rRNA C967 or C1407 C5-methylase (RsmB/RsmF family)
MGKGRLVAADVDRARLQRLAPRAERAGAAWVETLLMNPNRETEALAGLAGKVDAVLIDAPCSGTGTWRRNPEARWRLTKRSWRGDGDPEPVAGCRGGAGGAGRADHFRHLLAAGCGRGRSGRWFP